MGTTAYLRTVALYLFCAGCARGQVITTVAGTDRYFPTSGIPALNSPLGGVLAVAVDAKGNVYLSDPDNLMVARVSPDGVLTVVAGNGSKGYSGDGGPGTNAALTTPDGVAVDGAGNVYLVEKTYSVVRKVAPNGTISTFAGGGSVLGDGGPATGAALASPSGLAVDTAGNLYIADTNFNRIRKVTPNGTISTVAGNGTQGFSGDGGPATSAALFWPQSVAVDAAGNLYIADTSNQRIRKVAADGTISTIGGSGSQNSFGDGGPATLAGINYPQSVAVDAAGNVYIASFNFIREVTPDGTITTVAGGGSVLGDGGSATRAMLYAPSGVSVDSSGNLYIADTGNSRVRKVTPEGLISTVAGTGSFSFSGDGGPAANAKLHTPTDIAVDVAGNLYIADSDNGRVRKITPDGVMSTIAGGGNSSALSSDGGPATNANLFPWGIAVDAAPNLYIADPRNGLIRKVTPDGTISTIAGAGSVTGDGGPAAKAFLDHPTGVTVDATGDLYIADSWSNRIRKITPDGTISTIAGKGTQGFSGDGGPATSAEFYRPEHTFLDAAGNLYIADTMNSRVRKVTPDGTISTIAGGSTSLGDGGPATSAGLFWPATMTVDSAGNLYIADTNDSRIRKVAPNGTINTAAGGGSALGDGGPAAIAGLDHPNSVAVDAAGNIYIADTGNNRIREVVVAASTLSFKISSTSLTFTSSATGAPPPAQSVNLSSSFAGLIFSISSSAPWLSATPSSGSIPATLQVSVDPSKVTVGTYQGTITITAPNATPPRAIVAVTFTLQPAIPPKLNISLQTLNFTVAQGSGAQTGQIQVQNAGGGTLAFSSTSTTASGGSWLSVSPANGTATPASPVFLILTATPGSLMPGTYQGTVSIAGGGSTANVNVTLSVSTLSARILVSQSGLPFTAIAQGGAPLPQDFGILNIGQGSMDWSATASTLSGGSNWLRISPSSGTVAQPYLDVAKVSVSIDPTGLAAGDYYGRIQISASAANSPQSMTVILTVLPAGVSPGPEVRPAALIFTGLAGSTPGSQDVLLGNPKPDPDSFLSSQVGTGFTYTPLAAKVAPNQPATLRVFPDFSQLPPGDIVRGTVFLQFADGTPRAISVLIVVAPSPGASGALSPALEPQASSCSSKNLEIQFRTPSSQQTFTAALGKPTTVEVQVVDDCGNLIGPTDPQAASVTATFSNRDSDIRLTHTGNGIWTGTWRPVNPATSQVTIAVTAFNAVGLLLQSGQRAVAGALSTGVTPTVTAGGVVHAASDAAGVPIAPGSLITIYGSNLADAQGQATTLPLPQQQNGAQVLLGNLPLPILYTSGSQLNVQVPFNTPVNGQYQLSVQRDNLLSVPEQLVIAAAQPGVFTVNQQGTGQGVIFRSDGLTLARAGTPAMTGETVVIYCTGLGTVTNPVPEGTPPPSTPLSNTVNAVTVTIGGQNATVSFSGLTSGFPGLYQVNAVVPPGVSGNAVPVVVSVAGQTSPPVTIAVQ